MKSPKAGWSRRAAEAMTGRRIPPTELHRRTVQAGRNELAALRGGLDRIAEQVMPELERALEAAGAPPIEGMGR